MSNDIAIKVENLTKIYRLYRSPQDRLKESLHPLRKKYHNNFYALNGVSFEVKKGETFGIIGKNGSGKSTLLKIITGVLTPSAGNVTVKGRISALLELGIGFNPELSGMENVYFNGTLMGYSEEEMDARLDDILSFADIGEFIHQPMKTYSSGMFVRLAFAAATSIDPDVLIVDEALSVGDMLFQAKCMKKMKQLMAQGCTTLFVSHDTGAVKSLCSRVAYLQNGANISVGESGLVCDLYTADQMEREGLFRKSEESDRGAQEATSVSAQEVSPEKEVIFSERVEYFRKGAGDVKTLHAELLDERQQNVSEVIFGENLTFRVVYRAQRDLTDLVIAIYIKDKNMLEIIGTNNVYENVTLKNIKAHVTYCAEFTFENKLRGGQYSITAILADDVQSTEYYDWIDNAVLFKSRDHSDRPRWAFVNPTMHFQNKIVVTSTNKVIAAKDETIKMNNEHLWSNEQTIHKI